MTIHIYKSALCPRCAYAQNIIKKLKDEFLDIEVISYDIATDFSAFKEAGIKMIPSIVVNDNKKSWLLPTKSSLRDFVLEHTNLEA